MKIVFLVSRFPYPLEKGDKLRAYQHIQNMSAAGHEVHLIALSDCNIEENSFSKVKMFCSSVHILKLNYFNLFVNLCFAFFRKLPLQVAYFYSKKHESEIAGIISDLKPDVLYCQLIRTALFSRNFDNIPKIIDYQDAFSHGTYLRYLKAPLILKPIFKREFKLLKSFEEKSYAWFNKHFIISRQDLKSFGSGSDKNIIILPNGIDTQFFKPEKITAEFELTFVGNMNYPPNVDASRFLVKEIMPIIWSKMPKVRLQLAGANPTWQVKELASGRVKVTGWVDDIRDCYNNTLLFIAPMRIGTGLQNKLLEAMAMQIACVTTPISFEPLGAKINSDILVGSSAAELAEHVLSLLKDSTLRDTIALQGHDFVVNNYSLEKSGDVLNENLVSLIR